MFFSFNCQLLPENTVVIRMMPNLPCYVQEGALLFARGSHAKPEDGALLRSLLHHCGLVEEGPEAWIDIHTGMSGSGVAFVSPKMTQLWKIVNVFTGFFDGKLGCSPQVYLFAEALAEGAVKMGMPSALAHSIASQTVLVSFILSAFISLLRRQQSLYSLPLDSRFMFATIWSVLSGRWESVV